MTKYLRFQYSDLSGGFFTFQQDNATAHRARETVQLSTCKTPDVIAPALWPANSPDLNPVDYQTWGSIAARIMTLTSWSHAWSKSGNISTSDQAVASTSSSLHSSTRSTFWRDFSYVWYFYRRTLWQSYGFAGAYSGHYCFGVTLLNPL